MDEERWRKKDGEREGVRDKGEGREIAWGRRAVREKEGMGKGKALRE